MFRKGVVAMPPCGVPTERDLDLVVLKLLSMNCPKARVTAPRKKMFFLFFDGQAFVFLVILTWSSSHMPMVQSPFAVLEFFAGNGMVSRTCRYAHISTAQLDINLQKPRTTRAFDLTTPEGLVFLD